MLNDVQKIQIEIMDYIHDVCEKNNISYYIVGGTLIGALRHKGFIPWDIDIDISMPREDYSRFKNIFINECKESDFEYLDYSILDNFFKPHAIVRKKFTSFRIKDDINSKYDYGVFVDVFPLDKIPDNKHEQRKLCKKLNFYKNILYYKTSLTIPKNLFKRCVKKLFVLSLSLFSNRFIQNKILKIMTSNNHIQTNLLCNLAGKYSMEKEAHTLDVWGNPTKYAFEGRYYYGPEKADTYLRKIYGNYMELPSLEEQKMLSDYFDNLKVGKSN